MRAPRRGVVVAASVLLAIGMVVIVAVYHWIHPAPFERSIAESRAILSAQTVSVSLPRRFTLVSDDIHPTYTPPGSTRNVTYADGDAYFDIFLNHANGVVGLSGWLDASGANGPGTWSRRVTVAGRSALEYGSQRIISVIWFDDSSGDRMAVVSSGVPERAVLSYAAKVTVR
jgi:hypothetical protein